MKKEDSIQEQEEEEEGEREMGGGGENLVSWCSKSSQPQRIISGLRDTFLKRHVVERANKAEVRPADQSRKAELSGGFM